MKKRLYVDCVTDTENIRITEIENVEFFNGIAHLSAEQMQEIKRAVKAHSYCGCTMANMVMSIDCKKITCFCVTPYVDLVAAERHNPRDWFEKSAWRCDYDKYLLCYCPDCRIKDSCKHSGCYRRVPEIDGGLGLCPNLNL